jgi:hypothetical protein
VRLDTTAILAELVAASKAYAAAARAHYEATAYDDNEGMEQANMKAEKAYARLLNIWKQAEKALR